MFARRCFCCCCSSALFTSDERRQKVMILISGKTNRIKKLNKKASIMKLYEVEIIELRIIKHLR